MTLCLSQTLRPPSVNLRLVCATYLIHRLLNVTLHAVHTEFLIRPQSSTVQALLMTHPIQERQIFAAGRVVEHPSLSMSAVFHGVSSDTVSAQLDLCRTHLLLWFKCTWHPCLQNPHDSGALCVDVVGANISTAGRQPCWQGSRRKKAGSRTFSASKSARCPGSLGRFDALQQHCAATS